MENNDIREQWAAEIQKDREQLLSKRLTLGMTKCDVIALMGEPVDKVLEGQTFTWQYGAKPQHIQLIFRADDTLEGWCRFNS